MSEPIAEQIAAEFRQRLQVYTDSFRSTRIATWQPKDLVIHVSQGDIVKNDALSRPGNPPAQAWDLPMIVSGLVKPSDTETTSVDTYKNRFWAEIVKAATTGDQWHNWSGNAVNTSIGSVEDYTDSEGGIDGVQVTFTVTFRTDENNPFNARS